MTFLYVEEYAPVGEILRTLIAKTSSIIFSWIFLDITPELIIKINVEEYAPVGEIPRTLIPG